MSSESAKANAVIAGRALDSMKSGDLIRESVPRQPLTPASETSTESVKALNGIARGVLESLQSGALFTGTVRSHSTIGGVNVVRVAIELPLLGEREVLVRNDHELRTGQAVSIECVPNEAQPRRYAFRLANSANAGGSNGTSKSPQQ